VSSFLRFIEQCRIPPYKHQVVGSQKLIDHPYFGLFDEMGAGKTKQVIDAAQTLFLMNVINRVVVVSPAPVRDVWWGPELGELAKHLWLSIHNRVTEYHASLRRWDNGPLQQSELRWVVTNYDFIRRAERLEPLLKACNRKTLLVLDESSYIKNYKAQQTKAAFKLRKRSGRIVILNGTPIANSPADLYTQAAIMDPAILACQTFFHYRSRYAVMGGYKGKEIVAWHGLDEVQSRMAPYVIRRLTRDCVDIPRKIPPVTLTVPMDDKTWTMYRGMRDNMVTWLSETEHVMASQAIVKITRLSQITSGFLGGVEQFDEETEGSTGELDLKAPVSFSEVREISREKLDLMLLLLEKHWENEPNLKLIIWCRFRPELARLLAEVKRLFPHVALAALHGQQKRAERDRAIALMDPRTAPPGPGLLAGTPSTGRMGLNFTAAWIAYYMSNDYSLMTRNQSEARIYRPGQVMPSSYFDIAATGPKGQKTIDHAVLLAHRNKNDLASWTTAAWIKALTEE